MFIERILEYNINEHPHNQNKKKQKVNKEILEYVDINNIPSKTYVNITMVIEQNVISIFKNGKLHKTKALNGNPILNFGDLYHTYNKTFNGKKWLKFIKFYRYWF